MPTYEYRCPKGHEFEVVQRITDRARAKCPRCGLVAERQMSGGAGLIFKGSGFYITDYGKDGKGPRKEPESEVKGAKDAKDAKGAEGTKDAKDVKDAAAKPESEKPAKKKAKPRE
ncbi:MAG TPA: zinc ribbon domain-containing protein [Gemmatimonadales bacterium]|nr:zinc ribbon domain-containing protein [Gemmatimonadales bacterium]